MDVEVPFIFHLVSVYAVFYSSTLDTNDVLKECQGDLRKASSQRRSATRVGYATAPNDVWALGVILINLAAGRNPWRQASLTDETFCAYLADPNFLLKILPISRELNQILKRIFCVDPLRRISLDELRERIKRCKHFTRTPQVERLESRSRLSVNSSIPKVVLPPSPPASPRHSSSWKQHHAKATTQVQQQRLTTPPVSQDKAVDDDALLQNLLALRV